jgi:hypothetical protein
VMPASNSFSVTLWLRCRSSPGMHKPEYKKVKRQGNERKLPNVLEF